MSAEVAVFHHPDAFTPDVRRLFALGERDGLSLGEPWYRNLLQTLPPDAARFYVLRRDGRACAALPLMAAGGGRWRRGLRSLSNYYTAVYAPLIDPGLDAAGLLPLLEAVRRAHAPLASLRLQPMDPHTHAFRVLSSALRLGGWRTYEFHCFGNWFLRGHADWDDYLARRTSKLRSNIKRGEKKLAEDGGTVEILQTPADAARAIEAYQQVYAASWKQAEPFPGFMPGLIATCAEHGWLRMGVASLRGRPIAAQLWMVAHGKADIYKVAYDEAFKEYSPGTVVTARLMRHVIECDRVPEVDYLVGDDPYKKLWMSERRERHGLVAYDPRTVGGAAGAALEAAGRALKPALDRWRDRRGGPKSA